MILTCLNNHKWTNDEIEQLSICVGIQPGLGNCNIDIITFAIEKCETLKIWICSKDTEILQSSFKGNKSKSKSQQRTLQFHEILLLYH